VREHWYHIRVGEGQGDVHEEDSSLPHRRPHLCRSHSRRQDRLRTEVAGYVPWIEQGNMRAR
jgi:hypothetical protein